MRILVLLICLLFIAQFAYADHVYFDDGRTCKGCKVLQSGGYVQKVTDKTGKDWTFLPNQKMWIVKHPYLNSVNNGVSQASLATLGTMANMYSVYQATEATRPQYNTYNVNQGTQCSTVYRLGGRDPVYNCY